MGACLGVELLWPRGSSFSTPGCVDQGEEKQAAAELSDCQVPPLGTLGVGTGRWLPSLPSGRVPASRGCPLGRHPATGPHWASADPPTVGHRAEGEQPALMWAGFPVPGT